MSDLLNISGEAQSALLRIAREAVLAVSNLRAVPRIILRELQAPLADPGASFVSLSRAGQLRGCIGSLSIQKPLALDVQHHAGAAAREDVRFAPIAPHELGDVTIEISILSEPVRLNCSGPEQLLERITPGEDGVILAAGAHRATFLPHVWQKFPDPQQFMQKLCEKANLPLHSWEAKGVLISSYRTLTFSEATMHAQKSG